MKPPKNYRCITLGEDWREAPPEFWGTRDREQARATNQPLGQTLPVPPPERSLPAGFSLFPEKQVPPLTKGERAVAEIRSASR